MSDSLLIFGEANEAYHDNACASSSKLKSLNEKGALYYRKRYITKEIPKEEQTDALRLGCAIDTLVTVSVEQFDAEYVIKPEGMSFATTVGKDWKKAHCQGKGVISWDEWQMMQRLHAAILAHPRYPVLIHPRIKSQVTVRKPTTKYGTGLQSRPDWLSLEPCALSEGRKYSVNLKTTADWSDWFNESDPGGPQEGKPIYNYGYHRQAALDGWVLFQSPDVGETAHFLMVAEKEEPFRVGIVQMSETYLEAGWHETEFDLLRLQECIEKNEWPNGPADIVPINPPKWLTDRAMRKAAS